MIAETKRDQDALVTSSRRAYRIRVFTVTKTVSGFNHPCVWIMSLVSIVMGTVRPSGHFCDVS